MSKFAIVGAGFIGRAWAISFARAGHAVALWDQDSDAPGKALAYIDGLLPELAKLDLLNGNSAAQVSGRMRGVASLEAALADADYVQENTPEKLDVKRAIFARLDQAAKPDAILASNRFARPGTAFCSCTTVGTRNDRAASTGAILAYPPMPRTADAPRTTGRAAITDPRATNGAVAERIEISRRNGAARRPWNRKPAAGTSDAS